MFWSWERYDTFKSGQYDMHMCLFYFHINNK